MLTNKCKEEFEKWLLKWIKKNIAWESENPTQDDINHFYKFPLAMQQGVYFEFFDSEEIYITILNDFESVGYQIDNSSYLRETLWLASKSVVVERSIKRADTLFNRRNKKIQH